MYRNTVPAVFQSRSLMGLTKHTSNPPQHDTRLALRALVKPVFSCCTRELTVLRVKASPTHMCFRNWYESYRNLRSAHFHRGCLICVLHLFCVHSNIINLIPNQSDHQHQIFQHNIPQWSSSYPPPCYSAPSQELSPPRLVHYRSWELSIDYFVVCRLLYTLTRLCIRPPSHHDAFTFSSSPTSVDPWS